MYIHERIGIPIVFDYHHHKFCTDLTNKMKADMIYMIKKTSNQLYTIQNPIVTRG